MISYAHILEVGHLTVEALEAGNHRASFDPEAFTLAIDGITYRLYVRSDPAWSAGMSLRQEKVLKIGAAYDDMLLNVLTLLHEVGHHLNGDVERRRPSSAPEAQRQKLGLEVRAWQRAIDLFTAAFGPVPGETLDGAAQALATYLTDQSAAEIAQALMAMMVGPPEAAEDDEDPLPGTPFS